ncbi:MAG: RNA recognition motif domain-containing protein [Methylococcaceae bacterium]
MNIYVGNLSYQVDNNELRQTFERFGQVSQANVVMDKVSGRSMGFGFVEMPDKAAAEEAIKQMDGSELQGRAVRVNEARPRTENRGGGGFQKSRPPRNNG